MTQLDSLYHFVANNLPDRLMVTTGADAWMEDIQIIHAAKSMGNNQRRLAIRKYTATLAWDKWPYTLYDPDLLFALVVSWLIEFANEHYNRDEFPPPEVITELEDNKTAVVTISVELADDILLAEDAEGMIPLQGKRYSIIKDPDINNASKGWVYGAGNVGGPINDNESDIKPSSI